MHNDYINQYKNKQLGDIIVTTTNKELMQEYYGRNKSIRYVDYNAIQQVFMKVNELARQYNLSIKFPLIGCGLSNGDWDIVSDIILTTVDKDIEKILFVL